MVNLTKVVNWFHQCCPRQIHFNTDTLCLLIASELSYSLFNTLNNEFHVCYRNGHTITNGFLQFYVGHPEQIG